MTVNELAHAADVPPAKVRYYARRGLLPARREAGNGYRQFDNAALARLRFIATARVLGFALKDIERLLQRDLPKVVIPGYEPDPRIQALPQQNKGNPSRGGYKSGSRRSGNAFHAKRNANAGRSRAYQ